MRVKGQTWNGKTVERHLVTNWDFPFYRIIKMGSILSQLAMFMPWMENLTRILSLGHLSIIKDQADGLKEMYQLIRQQVDERKKSWVKGQPRDITDVYLDRIDETTDVSSSFHKSRTTQIQKMMFISNFLKVLHFTSVQLIRDYRE